MKLDPKEIDGFAVLKYGSRDFNNENDLNFTVDQTQITNLVNGIDLSEKLDRTNLSDYPNAWVYVKYKHNMMTKHIVTGEWELFCDDKNSTICYFLSSDAKALLKGLIHK